MSGHLADGLRASERRFRTLFESAPAGIALADLDGNILVANPALSALLGYPPEELVGDVLGRITHRDDLARELPLLRELVAGERDSYEMEKRYRCADGTQLWGRLHVALIRDEQGEPESVLRVMVDITEGRRAEASLRASEERYRQIVETMPGLVVQYRLDGTITFASRQTEDLLGYRPDDVVGRDVLEFMPPAYGVRAMDERARLLADGSGVTELRLRHRNGHWVWARASVSVIRNDGEPRELLAMVTDVSAEKHAEHQLAETNDQLRLAFEIAHMGTFDWDAASDRVRWSAELGRLCGLRPESFGHGADWVELIHPDDRLRVEQEFAAMAAAVDVEDYEQRYRFCRPDGEELFLAVRGRVFRDADGTPTRVLGLAWDETAHRRLEDQLLQAQKMEALGLLAGGVAHDFNNLLTIIGGYGELIESASREPGTRVAAATIAAAVERGTSLTSSLLAFSRRSPTRPRPVYLDDVVASAQLLIRRLLGEHVELAISFADHHAVVVCDPLRLEQALLNLAANGRDAMPDGGTLTLATDTRTVAEGDAAAELPFGRWAVVEVRDSGSGMDERTLAEAFSPFFTTKEQGKGTGLGLAVVQAIVEHAQGRVAISSTPGAGTTVQIALPLSLDAVPVQAAPQTAVTPAPVPRGETVLIVEDDPLVRTMVCDMVERFGYRVLCAGSAKEALTIAAAERRLDILVTDVVMPGGSGPELAAQLAAARPALRVLYTSGYTADELGERGTIPADVTLIEKPFSSGELRSRLAELAG